MTTKSKILDRLGERAVLLPELISAALASNDRAKLRLTMLQEALAHGENQGIAPRDLSTERRRAGLEDALFDNTIAGARPIGDQLYTIPGSHALLEGLFDDLNTMQAPLANSSPAHELAARMSALRETAPKATGDIIAASEIATLTRARHDGHDSAHLLIMDLHKALNRLTAEIAIETVAGAHVHQILGGDRGRVEAFMRGLSRTAPLAFGHRGLGTTATRSHSRLVIQNDIGVTDAHVLVIHVEEKTVTLTYTDVHRARAKFFVSLFTGWDVAFSPLAEDSAGLGKDQAFFLVTGTYQADGEASLDRMLEFLASRIVFLIDWNKARKALRAFVNKRATVEVLQWAAVHDHGHRAFLELGGPELIFESIRHIGGGRVPYGTRLDTVLGASATIGFLQSVLHIASDGLSSGRSTRLIRDEIQTELTQRFETAETTFYTVMLRHLGLSRMLAGLISDAMSAGRLASVAERRALVAQAKRLEHKADRLTIQAREIAQRLGENWGHLRPAADAVEDAADALDDAAFTLSLFPEGSAPRNIIEPVMEIAELATGSVADLVRSVEAAARLPEGARVDSVAALQAIDAVINAEKSADDAYRMAVAAILAAPSAANFTFIAIELARALESATDHLARAALCLRERVIEELSA
jgi:uncharacterized protein Yka (UPF0111/DUF47 family)